MVRENAVSTRSGLGMLIGIVIVLVASVAGIVMLARAGSPQWIWLPTLVILVDALMISGLFVVNPNEARVVLLFGNYLGTAKTPGFKWVNPFTVRTRVSLRVRNFESSKLKVNDQEGNPIEIAAIVVWRVIDTAEAVFEVDDYRNFVQVQTESALRNLATSYAYDSHVEGQMSLRGHTNEVAEQLKHEIQDRLSKAGVEVMEARISHLAYSPEIASAIVAARSRIVEGAVGMVEMALHQLAQKEIIHLDEERKAAMVSNLLVVLCSDHHAQPVVNTGTLYQ